MNAASTIEKTKPTKRLQVTVTAAQHRLLRQAAMTSGKSVSAFIAETASAAAYSLLADNPDFLLDDPDWEHFLGLLGHPPSELDALRDLLDQPTPTAGGG